MFSFKKFSVNIIIGDDIVETLKDYFLCNSECDLSKIFYKLYGDLEIIHDNGMYVPTLDSEHILYDDGKFSFGEMDSSHSKDNIRGNIFLHTFTAFHLNCCHCYISHPVCSS